MTEKSKEIVKIISLNGDGDGSLGGDLLQRIWSGVSPLVLLPLLHSKNDKNVKIGIWLASELGNTGAALLDKMPALLSNPVPYVRFYAIDCVLVSASSEEHKALVSAASCISDEDEVVGAQAIKFLSRISQTKMKAIARHMVGNELLDFFKLLINALNTTDLNNEIILYLESENVVKRRIGLVAAIRLLAVTELLLLVALKSSYDEIRIYAAEEWSFYTERNRSWQRLHSKVNS